MLQKIITRQINQPQILNLLMKIINQQKKGTNEWERGKEETFANNVSIHNTTLDIEKEFNTQKYNDEVDNKSRHQNQNISIESSMSQIFETKEPGQTEISGEVQETFCLPLNINTIPEPVFKQFKGARWIKSLSIINIFGGSLTALAQQLCYHKPSTFIDEFPKFTMHLIKLSHYEIKISYQNNTMSSKSWLKLKKNKAYDTKFINISERHCRHYD